MATSGLDDHSLIQERERSDKAQSAEREKKTARGRRNAFKND
jgi:hypothetical protein